MISSQINQLVPFSLDAHKSIQSHTNQVRMNFPPNLFSLSSSLYTQETRLNAFVKKRHSCGYCNNRILRTAYYRHGACVICLHVLGRIHEFSCHGGTNRQNRTRRDKTRAKKKRASISRVPTPERMLVKGE